MTTFVKSAKSKVMVSKSQADIVLLLGKYGARDFGFDTDPALRVATVRFRITHGGRNLPIELRVEVDRVFEALYGKGAIRDIRRVEQAERTSWRLLIDWLDASLSTTSMGIQTVEEVFMAHTVLTDADGVPRRMIDHYTRAVSNNSQLRLTAGKS